MKMKSGCLTFWILALTGMSLLAAPRANEEKKTKTSLPFVFFVDSSLIYRYPTTWRTRLKELDDTSSSNFEQQFATNFNLTKVITVKMQRDTAITADAAFNALVGGKYPGGDTISILLYSDTTIDTDAPIAETEIGRKQIALRERRYADSSDIRGWAIVQALTLLHELGHSFGAIHVSDVNSVMNHSPSPVGTYMYDPVNRQIIEQALRGNFSSSGTASYITEVSKIIQTTKYFLSDYPEFFQPWENLVKMPSFQMAIPNAIGHESFLTAAAGLTALSVDDSVLAIKLFDSALTQDSSMAALWYYRGLATTKKTESNRFLKHAADAGYYLAQELLHKRENESK